LIFRDRQDAGRQLAIVLQRFRSEGPLVLGLARGGVVLAHQIATVLDCDLDVLVARKVGAPGHPEFGIGAVAPDGVQVSNPRVLEFLAISESAFDQLANRERAEVDRRLLLYRSRAGPPAVRGRTAIVVDDGLATGVTALASARYVRTLQPRRLVLAVPVCSQPAHEVLQPEVDEMICLSRPEQFRAVGEWYQDFSQVEDDEILDLLKGSPIPR